MSEVKPTYNPSRRTGQTGNSATPQRKKTITYNQGKPISDADFLQHQQLDNAAGNARTFLNVIFVVAALTTAAFGFITSINGSPLVQVGAEAIALTARQKAVIYIQATFASLLITVLLDGARYGWSQARVSANTVPLQQSIALGMIWANFAGSVYASVYALPVLLSFLGLPIDYNPQAMSASLSLLLQVSMGANVVFGFLYWSQSPQAKQLTMVSKIESRKKQMYMLKTEKAMEGSFVSQSRELDSYIEAIAQQDAMKGMQTYLRSLGFSVDEPLQLENGQNAASSPTPSVVPVFMTKQKNDESGTSRRPAVIGVDPTIIRTIRKRGVPTEKVEPQNNGYVTVNQVSSDKGNKSKVTAQVNGVTKAAAGSETNRAELGYRVNFYNGTEWQTTKPIADFEMAKEQAIALAAQEFKDVSVYDSKKTRRVWPEDASLNASTAVEAAQRLADKFMPDVNVQKVVDAWQQAGEKSPNGSNGADFLA